MATPVIASYKLQREAGDLVYHGPTDGQVEQIHTD